MPERRYCSARPVPNTDTSTNTETPEAARPRQSRRMASTSRGVSPPGTRTPSSSPFSTSSLPTKCGVASGMDGSQRVLKDKTAVEAAVTRAPSQRERAVRGDPCSPSDPFGPVVGELPTSSFPSETGTTATPASEQRDNTALLQLRRIESPATSSPPPTTALAEVARASQSDVPPSPIAAVGRPRCATPPSACPLDLTMESASTAGATDDAQSALNVSGAWRLHHSCVCPQASVAVVPSEEHIRGGELATPWVSSLALRKTTAAAGATTSSSRSESVLHPAVDARDEEEDSGTCTSGGEGARRCDSFIHPSASAVAASKEHLMHALRETVAPGYAGAWESAPPPAAVPDDSDLTTTASTAASLTSGSQMGSYYSLYHALNTTPDGSHHTTSAASHGWLAQAHGKTPLLPDARRTWRVPVFPSGHAERVTDAKTRRHASVTAAPQLVPPELHDFLAEPCSTVLASMECSPLADEVDHHCYFDAPASEASVAIVEPHAAGDAAPSADLPPPDAEESHLGAEQGALDIGLGTTDRHGHPLTSLSSLLAHMPLSAQEEVAMEQAAATQRQSQSCCHAHASPTSQPSLDGFAERQAAPARSRASGGSGSSYRLSRLLPKSSKGSVAEGSHLPSQDRPRTSRTGHSHRSHQRPAASATAVFGLDEVLAECHFLSMADVVAAVVDTSDADLQRARAHVAAATSPHVSGNTSFATVGTDPAVQDAPSAGGASSAPPAHTLAGPPSSSSCRPTDTAAATAEAPALITASDAFALAAAMADVSLCVEAATPVPVAVVVAAHESPADVADSSAHTRPHPSALPVSPMSPSRPAPVDSPTDQPSNSGDSSAFPRAPPREPEASAGPPSAPPLPHDIAPLYDPLEHKICCATYTRECIDAGDDGEEDDKVAATRAAGEAGETADDEMLQGRGRSMKLVDQSARYGEGGLWNPTCSTRNPSSQRSSSGCARVTPHPVWSGLSGNPLSGLPISDVPATSYDSLAGCWTKQQSQAAEEGSTQTTGTSPPSATSCSQSAGSDTNSNGSVPFRVLGLHSRQGPSRSAGLRRAVTYTNVTACAAHAITPCCCGVAQARLTRAPLSNTRPSRMPRGTEGIVSRDVVSACRALSAPTVIRVTAATAAAAAAAAVAGTTASHGHQPMAELPCATRSTDHAHATAASPPAKRDTPQSNVMVYTSMDSELHKPSELVKWACEHGKLAAFLKPSTETEVTT